MLGKTVQDVVTGFKGRVLGHAEYITGCDQYLVQPECKPLEVIEKPKGEWFDESRLKVVDNSMIELANPAAVAAGGDLEAPKK